MNRSLSFMTLLTAGLVLTGSLAVIVVLIVLFSKRQCPLSGETGGALSITAYPEKGRSGLLLDKPVSPLYDKCSF